MRNGPTDPLRMTQDTAGTQKSENPTETIAPVAGTSAGVYTFASVMRLGIIRNNSGKTINVRINGNSAGDATASVYDFSITNGSEFLFELCSGFKIKSFAIYFPAAATTANFEQRIGFFQ